MPVKIDEKGVPIEEVRSNSLTSRMLKLLKDNPGQGYSIDEVCAEFSDASVTYVASGLNKMFKDGQANKTRIGSRVYYFFAKARKGAKKEAVEPVEKQTHPRGRPRKWSDEQLLSCLRTIGEAIGHPPSMYEYDQYRAEFRGRSGPPLASGQCIMQRFGHWEAALVALRKATG